MFILKQQQIPSSSPCVIIVRYCFFYQLYNAAVFYLIFCVSYPMKSVYTTISN